MYAPLISKGDMCMDRFIQHAGKVIPLDRTNVDTDQMVPKQFCKLLTREGYGRILFYDWRYLPGEIPNPGFVLNEPRYRNASILLTGANFGCGSSREHAPWAILDYGIRAILAPSYADIFYNNCFKNGILPVVLSDSAIQGLFERVRDIDGYSLTIDLFSQVITDGRGLGLQFEMNAFRKKCLMQGVDDIGLSSEHEDEIAAYESRNPRSVVAYDSVDFKFSPA
jgi:3-isopropylmalate/(R)-2-methylmalate dehydratase small subunit